MKLINKINEINNNNKKKESRATPGLVGTKLLLLLFCLLRDISKRKKVFSGMRTTRQPESLCS